MRELLLNEVTSVRKFQVKSHSFEPHSYRTAVTKHGAKLQNFVEKISQRSEHKKPLYSFEISPSKIEEKFEHLMNSSADLLSSGRAVFTSVTWHLAAPHSKPDWSSVPAVRLACGLSKLVQPFSGAPGGVLLNLSAAGLREHDVTSVLETISQLGNIRALFIVRGDGPGRGGDFAHAIDLLKFVRSQPLGQQLDIGVAGYPLGHPESSSYQEDLRHLKEKVDAGADFIISQVVFDAGTFLQFSEDCRSAGIKVPILPGIPIVTSVELLERLCQLCKVPAPQPLLSQLAGDPRAGLRWCAGLTRQLLAAGVPAVHFFTLNSMENLKEVLRKLTSKGCCTGMNDEHLLSDPESKETLGKTASDNGLLSVPPGGRHNTL